MFVFSYTGYKIRQIIDGFHFKTELKYGVYAGAFVDCFFCVRHVSMHSRRCSLCLPLSNPPDRYVYRLLLLCASACTAECVYYVYRFPIHPTDTSVGIHDNESTLSLLSTLPLVLQRSLALDRPPSDSTIEFLLRERYVCHIPRNEKLKTLRCSTWSNLRGLLKTRRF